MDRNTGSCFRSRNKLSGLQGPTHDVAAAQQVVSLNAAADSYRARSRRVLDYIDVHLDEELDVGRLSKVAAV